MPANLNFAKTVLLTGSTVLLGAPGMDALYRMKVPNGEGSSNR